MPNLFSPLASLTDRFPARPAEIEPRRDAGDDRQSFDEAFAARGGSTETTRRGNEGAADASADADQSRVDDVASNEKRRRGAASPRTAHPSRQLRAQEKSVADEKARNTEITADAPLLAIEGATLLVADEAPVESSDTISGQAFAEALTPLIDAEVLASAPPIQAPADFVQHAFALPEQSVSDGVSLASASPEGATEPSAALTAGAITPQISAEVSELAAAALQQAQSAPKSANTPQFAADDAASAPETADLLNEVKDEASDLHIDQAPAAIEKPKEKTLAAVRGFELAQELAPAPSDRGTQSPVAQAATEIRHHQAAVTPASIEAAAQVVAAIRADRGSNEIDVRLDPPELGRVRISLTIERSDIVTATVSSERTDTLDLMRRHQDELARELERAGFSKVRLDFSASDSGRAFSDQPRQQQSWREDFLGGDATEDVRVHYLTLRGDNRLDRLV